MGAAIAWVDVPGMYIKSKLSKPWGVNQEAAFLPALCINTRL